MSWGVGRPGFGKCCGDHRVGTLRGQPQSLGGLPQAGVGELAVQDRLNQAGTLLLTEDGVGGDLFAIAVAAISVVNVSRTSHIWVAAATMT